MLIEKVKDYLVPDAAQAHKFWSTRLAALLALLIPLKDELMPLLQGLIPEQSWKWIFAALAALIIVARVYKQPGLDRGEASAEGEGQGAQ